MHLISLPLGLLSCWFFSKYFHFNVILASGLSTLIFSLIPMPKVRKSDRLNYDGAFFCGSFIGMGDIGTTTPVYLHLSLLSVFGILLYMFFVNKWLGLGGKLGTIAFMAFSFVAMGLRLWK